MKPQLHRGRYRVGCTYMNQRMRRLLKTGNEMAANGVQAKIDARLEQLTLGMITLPEGLPVRDFLLYGRTVPVGKATASVTMDELREAFMKSQEPPKTSAAYFKTLQFYAVHFKRFLDAHPQLPADPAAWNHTHLEQYRSWRLSGKKVGDGKKRTGRKPRPYTVAKEEAYLGRMFQMAVRREWAVANPVDNLESQPDTKPEVPYRTITEAHDLLQRVKTKPEERRLIQAHRYFLLDEIDTFLELVWEAALREYVDRPGDVAMILTIAAWTGMRFGEIARLDRLDVDLDLGVITTRSRKQSRSRAEVQRHIPIIEELAPKLRSWLERHPGRLLFGMEADSTRFRDAFYTRMDRITRGTPFERVRPHMLRHSMRSNLTMAGEDERRIDEILGHTTEETRQRYRHIQLARLKASMAALRKDSRPTIPEQGATPSRLTPGFGKNDDRQKPPDSLEYVLLG